MDCGYGGRGPLCSAGYKDQGKRRSRKRLWISSCHVHPESGKADFDFQELKKDDLQRAVETSIPKSLLISVSTRIQK